MNLVRLAEQQGSSLQSCITGVQFSYRTPIFPQATYKWDPQNASKLHWFPWVDWKLHKNALHSKSAQLVLGLQFHCVKRMSERTLKAGTKMFFGAPAKPMPEIMVDAIAQVVAQVPGIQEAHLPQCFIEGDKEARQVVVIGVQNRSEIP